MMLGDKRRGLIGRLTGPAVLAAGFGFALVTPVSAQEDFERIAPQEPPAMEGGGEIETPAPALPSAKPGTGTLLLPELKGIALVADPAMIAEEGTQVSGISGKGLEAGDVERAAAALQPFLGRPLHEGDLNAISRAVIEAYRAAGRPFVDVSFPPQDVTEGSVQVLVTEFRLGAVEVRGNEWFAEGLYREGLGLQPGSPIETEKLKRGINHLNANPFRQVNAVLKPGASPGATDIELKAKDRFPLRVYASYDNTGTPVTDRDRWSTGFNWGNAFWLGHQLSYQITTSGDVLHERERPAGQSDDPRFIAHAFTYTAPLPWFDTLQIFGSHVKQVPNLGPFFGQEGRSYQLSARYRRPLPSLSFASHSVSLGFDHKSTNNNLAFGGTQVFANTTNVDQFLLTYEASAADEYGQTALTNSFVYSPGNLNSHNTDQAFAASGAAFADSEYLYDTLELTRVTQLPYDASWVLRAKGQWADGNLIASEQLGGGGVDSVRGYEERAVNRATGALLSSELRSPAFPVLGNLADGLSDRGQLVAFWDYGYLRDRDAQPGTPQTATLESAGVGARYVLDRYLSVRFDYGWQLRELPGAAEKGQLGTVSVTLSY
ncbi:ShlB/FhaC/HecB family hemolysin secretion/activation protein [Tepidicaulis sp.]|uniref:ShlB/FhaC/HecB family hemolysin secretion/activation protein n=1 Tax=Tepidicaulis sp. TaxID=1920809 RepID=UPI003B5AE345